MNRKVVTFDNDVNIIDVKEYNSEIQDIIIKRKLSDKQKYVIGRTSSIKEFIKDNEGGFFHNKYKYIYPYMQELNGNNVDIIRMILLSTYMSNNYKCYDDNNNEIKKSSLMKVWDIKNRKERNNTYDRLKAVNYISEDEKGCILINECLFKKGSMKSWIKSDNNDTYTRLFTKSIQEMYYNCKHTERRRLANFFKILPFINFKYNTLCMNPMEVNEKKVEPLSWKDLCLVCGYNETEYSKLKKELLKLKIYEYNVIGEFITGNGNVIVINPKVYYGGNDVENVKHLYSLFRIAENSKKV